jgi:putative ABC transport system permease protein
VLPLRNLLRRKVRTLFAVLQIAVAIAAFVSIVGVTQGLRAQFYRISQVFAFDLILQTRGAASPIFSGVTDPEVEAARKVPNRSQPVTMLALEPGSELLRRYRIVAGRGLAPEDQNVVVIGDIMAQEMKLGVGSRIGIQGGESFEVVGLFEPPVKDVPFLAGQAILPLGYHRKMHGVPANLLVAHMAPGRTASGPDEVREGLAKCKAVAPALDAALPRKQARTIEDFLDSFKQAELIDSFALAISFLAALVSAIGVTNTMLMSVFDRTREIGLLRAIGWSRARIIAMVEVEGLLLAIAGGLLGLPIGLVLIQMSKLLIQLGWLSVTLDPPLYAQAVGFAALIGVLGALYPAWRAAQLQPTEALRYE